MIQRQSKDTRAIGLFDSGIGGLTVLQQLVRVLPYENFIYFGDTARLPYGDKSPETILRYSIENARFLNDKGIKMLVVPCNTASAYALEKLQQELDVPVVGVIGPGADRAVASTKSGCIGVLGTRGTVKSEAYRRAILEVNPKAHVVQVACPLFVPLVEENFIAHPAARLIVRDYLKSLKEHRIDTLLLGCTHYPLLKPLIAEEMGDEVAIIDSASSCADKVDSILNQLDLKNNSGRSGCLSYYVSDDPMKFKSLGQSLLGMPIDKVELVQKAL